MTPLGASRTNGFEVVAVSSVLVLAAVAAGMIVFVEPRPLSAVATQPRDGAADVPFTAKILLTLSRPVDEGSATPAIDVAPATKGFVSAAGRRVAFAASSAFRADTDYRVTIGTGLRDRTGRSLAEPITIRFRTRGLGILVRTDDGRLLRAKLHGSEPRVVSEPLTGPGVGEFAVSPGGDLAYLQLAEGRLVIQPSGGGAPRQIQLPRSGSAGPARTPSVSGPGIEVRELAWAPGGMLIGFVAARRDGVVLPHLIDLHEAAAPIEPFGLPSDQISLNTSPAVAAHKKSLLEEVYRRETFAFTPDGSGIIVRDRKWDFVVFGFDGTRRGTFGPFLSVANASRRGQFVAFVDVDPADTRLRRQVVGYERTGRIRSLTAPDRDSHSPQFAHWTDRVVYATGEAVGSPERRRFALETLDLTTGERARLTGPPPGASDADPQWSPDDAWITFRRAPVADTARGQVWIVPAEGGAARPLDVPGATVARWVP